MKNHREKNKCINRNANGITIESVIDQWKHIYEFLLLLSFPKELCNLIKEYVIVLWFHLPCKVDHLCTYLTNGQNQILVSSKDLVWLFTLSDVIPNEDLRFQNIPLPLLKEYNASSCVTHHHCHEYSFRTTSKMLISQSSQENYEFRFFSYCVNSNEWNNYGHPSYNNEIKFDIFGNKLFMTPSGKILWFIRPEERINNAREQEFAFTQNGKILTQVGWTDKNLVLHIWNQPSKSTNTQGTLTILPLQTYDDENHVGRLFQRMDQEEEQILVIVHYWGVTHSIRSFSLVDLFVIHLKSKTIIWIKRLHGCYKDISGVIINKIQNNIYSLYLKSSDKIYCM